MACTTMRLEQEFRASVRPYQGWTDPPRSANWGYSPVGQFARLHRDEDARRVYFFIVRDYARSVDESDRVLARAALFALAQGRTDSVAERTILLGLVEDHRVEVHVRVSAAEALESAEGTKAWITLVRLLERAALPVERQAIVQGILERHDPDAIPALRAARDRETDPDLRHDFDLVMELLAKPGLCVLDSQRLTGSDGQSCVYRCAGSLPVMRFPLPGQCPETWPDLPEDRSSVAVAEQDRLRQLFEEAARQQTGLGRDVADPSDDSQWPLGRFRKLHQDQALAVYFDELERHKVLHGSSADEVDLIWAALDGIERLRNPLSAPRLESIAGDLRYEVARIGALRVLATLPGQNKVDTYGKRLLVEPDPTYREMIVTILGEDANRAALPYIEKALLSERVPAVKGALQSVRRGLSDPGHCFLSRASADSCVYSCLKRPFAATAPPAGGRCAETIAAPGG